MDIDKIMYDIFHFFAILIDITKVKHRLDNKINNSHFK